MFKIICLLMIGGCATISAHSAAYQCAALDPLFYLLPTNLLNALDNLGNQCALEACDIDGVGYFDIYCNWHCALGLYSGGTCFRNVTGYTGCNCHGNGFPLLLIGVDLVICNVIAPCICQTCNNGATPPVAFTNGACSVPSSPGGVIQVNCS